MKSRRHFILGLLAGVPLSVFGRVAHALKPTPPEIEGPFYPLMAQKDKDFDLTKVEGRDGVAKGEVVFIEGRVLDTDGRPVEGAIVDLWQANAAGRYRHKRDPRNAPLDPNFQGWAIVQSGAQGTFRFKTILPGAYPATPEWMRPPHIHFKVSRKSYVGLTTQMYFSGQELNESDLLLMQKSRDDAQLMIAPKSPNEPGVYLFDLVLKSV